MSDAQLLQAEYDECERAIHDPETLADDRGTALRRAAELRAPLKAATDAAISHEVDIDVTYRLP